MKEIRIELRIIVPDEVEMQAPVIAASTTAGPDPVEAFWAKLGTSSRKLFTAAALIETSHGPGYTFDDVAQSMSVDHETVLAYNRNYSRTANTWEKETGTPAPIRFTFDSYGSTGDDGTGPERSVMRIGELAGRILDLPPHAD